MRKLHFAKAMEAEACVEVANNHPVLERNERFPVLILLREGG